MNDIADRKERSRSVAAAAPDPQSIALADIDVSKAAYYGSDTVLPLFARLRAEDPVHYCANGDAGAYWSVTRYEDVKYVDSHHELFSSQIGGITIADIEAQPEVRLDNFISMDQPRHDAQRKTVAPSVAPTNLALMEPLIRERVTDILDNLPIGETFNWVDQVSIELTARMLATLFDFPYADRRKLIHWSDVTTSSPQIMGEAGLSVETRAREFADCANTFASLWHERARSEPRNDLISMLAHGESTRDMLSRPQEFIGNIMLLIVGGNDTTRNSISGGLLALNQFPDEYRKLEESPKVIPNMVSEMIRWQTPVIHMRRTPFEDTKLGGKTLRAGDKVVMWYLSANRDESVFPDADRLIIDRPNARSHVSFGFGIHRCMGNRLAEMQLKILWEEIQKRFRRIDVVGPVLRVPNNFIRGIADLPVQVQPR